MQRYYFDLSDGPRNMQDEAGTLFNTLKEARDAAIRLLPEIAQEELPDGDRHVFAVRIRDDNGKYLFHATLSLIAQDLTA